MPHADTSTASNDPGAEAKSHAAAGPDRATDSRPATNSRPATDSRPATHSRAATDPPAAGGRDAPHGPHPRTRDPGAMRAAGPADVAARCAAPPAAAAGRCPRCRMRFRAAPPPRRDGPEASPLPRPADAAGALVVEAGAEHGADASPGAAGADDDIGGPELLRCPECGRRFWADPRGEGGRCAVGLLAEGPR